MPRRTLAPRRGWLFDLSWISDTPSPLMQTRLAVVAPLMLAAVLQAQEPPAGQGPTPQQQLEKLKAEKQRLQREIEFAKKRAQQASGLLSNKLRRGAPKFRSIDAGKPGGMLDHAEARQAQAREDRHPRGDEGRRRRRDGRRQPTRHRGQGVQRRQRIPDELQPPGSARPGRQPRPLRPDPHRRRRGFVRRQPGQGLPR